jgi:hypothetical protein
MLYPMFHSELALRPNCLLTRRPLVFLTGPRSVFYYQTPWQKAYYYLTEHGYQAQIVKLPFQKISDRIQYTRNVLRQLENSHIFCDQITYQQLSEALTDLKDSTLTVFADQNFESSDKNLYKFQTTETGFSLSYFLHQKYLQFKGLSTPSYGELLQNPSAKTYSKLLDHCIQLAELDFYELDLNT